MTRRQTKLFRSIATLGLCASVWLASAPGFADEVRLNNGDRLSGQITGIDGDKLVLKTPTFGTVKIPAGEVAGLTTDGPVTIEFKEGGYATGRLSTGDAGAIRLTGPNATSSQFDLAQAKAIHPGGKIPVPQFEWKGRVNAGASKTNGNTKNQAFNVDAEAQGRGAKDRITLSAEYNRESSSGADTVDNARLAAQYDRFISKKWFLYLQGSGERDDFEDLNLRTTIGAGAGYQVIDTDLTQLSIEGGPTYVNEDFQTAADQDFISARWAVKFDHFIFDKFAQLFHNHEGLVSLENTSDVLIRSKTGVRIPIRDNWNATAQVNLDWDNVPAPGRKKTDTKYILSLGYNW